MPPRVARTQNLDEIHRILRDPAVYPFIRDDTVPKDPADFTVEGVLGKDDVDFYGVYDGQEIVGLWLVMYHDDVAEVHTNFLPSHRGRFAKTAALILLDTLFSVDGVKSVTSYVPTCNEPAYHFAKWCGMRDTGLRQAPFTLDGVDYPVREVAIRKSEWCEV